MDTIPNQAGPNQAGPNQAGPTQAGPTTAATLDDTWEVAGLRFRSRLIVGTGRYKDLEETGRAIDASGAEIVTVAGRRGGPGRPRGTRATPRTPWCRPSSTPSATPTCRTPPAASPRRTRSAPCAWPARPAAGLA